MAGYKMEEIVKSNGQRFWMIKSDGCGSICSVYKKDNGTWGYWTGEDKGDDREFWSMDEAVLNLLRIKMEDEEREIENSKRQIKEEMGWIEGGECRLERIKLTMKEIKGG